MGGDEYSPAHVWFFILERNKLWIQSVSGHAGGAACRANRGIKDAERSVTDVDMDFLLKKSKNGLL